jgi:hypothetical protein
MHFLHNHPLLVIQFWILKHNFLLCAGACVRARACVCVVHFLMLSTSFFCVLCSYHYTRYNRTKAVQQDAEIQRTALDRVVALRSKFRRRSNLSLYYTLNLSVEQWILQTKRSKGHISEPKSTNILEGEMKICYSILQSQRYAIYCIINSLRMLVLFHCCKIFRCINCRS